MTHPLTRRRVLATLASTAALPAALPTAWANAADWPTRPVRLVVPAPPGGGADLIGRLLADQLGKAFKQTFVVDNKPGANGMLASDQVVRAQPDGQTLLFSFAGATVISPALYKRAPHPTQQLTPLAQVAALGNVLMVRPDLKVNTLDELLALAKAKPLSYATWGIGSGPHLTTEHLLQRNKVQMTHVPYQGVSPIATDMLSGVISVGWLDASTAIGYAQDGKLKALTVSGPDRMPQFPKTLTMREQGHAFDTTSWYGLFAPAKLPPALVERLNQAVVSLVQTPAFRERLASLNMPNSPTPTAAAFTQTVAQDLKVWGDIARKLGFTPT